MVLECAVVDGSAWLRRLGHRRQLVLALPAAICFAKDREPLIHQLHAILHLLKFVLGNDLTLLLEAVLLLAKKFCRLYCAIGCASP